MLGLRQEELEDVLVFDTRSTGVPELTSAGLGQWGALAM